MPIDLDRARNATDEQVARRFHALYGPALPRTRAGRQVIHGLPFHLGPGPGAPRWVLLDAPTTIDLDRRAAGGMADGLAERRTASHLVIAHLCDTWRDDAGHRPDGLAVGHVVPVGEPLARYTVVDRSGRRTSRVIRRRFEINDGILGWGSTAFAATADRTNEVMDWRGPHERQVPGRYASAGHSGSLTIMPGTYGANQTGMTDFVPSATDDVLLWLHTIELGSGAEPVELHLEPLSGGRPGSDVIVAAVTLFRGTDDPLVREPRFTIRVDGVARPPEVDLGTVIRSRPVPSVGAAPGDQGRVAGWGTPRVDATAPDAGPGSLIVDLAMAPDAIVDLDGWHVSGHDLRSSLPPRDPAGTRSIVVLPPPSVPVEVEIVDGSTGERIPARVRFVAADGRYLPPVGHRDEINPGFFEDTGGDLILGSSEYAYVPGRFDIDLPVGGVDVEVVGGFDRAPHRTRLEVDPGLRRLELPLDRTIDLHAGRWVTADTHVHFLAPSTALLQAAAEDVAIVNLLAAQWGDLYTNVNDLPWGSMADPSGRRIVSLGTENRQNVLGHLALLGARRPPRPFASAGPPEGRMFGALDVLLADWADRCRADGGLVVAAHFPLPYAEIAADIVAGKIDALETQALSPGLDDPSVIEWYRFLNLGYRLPIVAGTDKMSSEVPIGAVRAYGHLIADEPLTFERWADAVRAGRTFVTSGPILELLVDGHEPGAVIALESAGRLEVTVRARAAQPVIAALELVVNGRVVAATAGMAGGSSELALHEHVDIPAGSWIAARSRSGQQIESAFTSSMAAHTSPVYVEVRDRPLIPPADDAAVVEEVILGARTWVAGMAAVADPAERARMVRFFDASLDTLRRRMSARPPDPAGG
ncbi:MAG TPA: CehA/McbA family metallohydrolase [Candidatus Acidoferrum sp.]|nr:CehA/McbA family metallohydrolase [Candidatus Acidoferrum sp.]